MNLLLLTILASPFVVATLWLWACLLLAARSDVAMPHPPELD
jgi:hypothetical protein